MLALFCGLALAADTLTPAHPDAAGPATDSPAEPVQDRKLLSAAADAESAKPDSEVEVETPAVEKREEEMRKKQVMQIAEEVQETLEGDARSSSSEKKEEVKHENLVAEGESAKVAEGEAPPVPAATRTEAKAEVAEIAEEVQQSLQKEAAKDDTTADAEVVDPKPADAAPDTKNKVMQAELTETALVATRANSSMHFATLLACMVSIALIGHLRRTRPEVTQPPLLG
jgi:hypothetical protein